MKLLNAERRQIGSQTYDYLQVRWYSQDAESKIRITFKNGLPSRTAWGLAILIT